MGLMKVVGAALVGTSLMLMMVCLLRKNESFFNLRDIITKQLRLFQNCKSQYIIFYIFPLGFAVGLAMLYEAGDTFYSQLSVVVSILLSMLLTILSILTGKDYDSINSKDCKDRIGVVIGETFTAIMFDSLLCISLLLYSLIMVVVDGISFDVKVLKCVFAGIAYYLFIVILLTLFLIVKRMCKIIEINLKAKK